MSNINHNLSTKEKRQRRVSQKLFGTEQRPRLAVYRSNQHLYLQVIDDEAGQTLAAASDIGQANQKKGTKLERAKLVAEELAEELKKKKIKNLVFDRRYYRYHGRVKMVAETLREAGLNL